MSKHKREADIEEMTNDQTPKPNQTLNPNSQLVRGVARWADDDRPYIIHAEKLEKIYDIGTPRETKALRGINLDISLGEIVLIFGSSGSGKSTLLNILAALDKPTSGRIEVDKKDLAKMTYKQQVEYHQFKVGMVFQSYNLIPNLTVMQNITMPARLAGFNRKEFVARGADLLKQFQLEKIHDRLASNLSGGQQQRVAIMRSLMNRPAMIIADEPTGNLDSENSRMMMDIFKRMNEETTTTMVIVSHDPSLFEIADRVVHILDGRVVKQTILSPKAKIDPKTIDVPVDYRLTKEDKEQLLRELGAKTAYKDKEKRKEKMEKRETVPTAVEEVRKQWHLEDREMAELKAIAVERLKMKAKQEEIQQREQWQLEEKEMVELKALALERVKLRSKDEKGAWQAEEKAMEQVKVASLTRVEVRRRAEKETWQAEEQAMNQVKKAARQRISGRKTREAQEQKQTWQHEEEEVAGLKAQAQARIKKRWMRETQAWQAEEEEMEQLKAAAVFRVREKKGKQQQATRETFDQLRELYRRKERGKPRGAFARLILQRSRLDQETQHILAALLVLLDHDQQNSLSELALERLIDAVQARLQGQLDYVGLLEALDLPEKDGGVGLYRQTAEHLATGIEALLLLGKEED